MMNNYKNAMDRIKANPEFKAQLLQKLENAELCAPVQRKPIRLLKTLTYAASAAACLLIVFCVATFFANPPKTSVTTAFDQTGSVNPDIIYINFDGFEQYDIEVESKAILLNNTMKEDYTLTRLINEYYNDVVIYDGMLDSINGVEATEQRQLNIYVDDCEILNLNNEQISQYFNKEAVYFTVTVTE